MLSTSHVLWSPDCRRFVRCALYRHNPVGDLTYHFFQQQPEMAVAPVVSRRDMPNSICVGGQVKTFAKTESIRVVRVIDGDGMAAVFFHDRKTGHVGRP